ncbi:nicotinate-nucleotide--dimethylbenzimidazole phosphoribosyltransferase [Falsirhodobacter halotolerans]|uniref:nicotinate-nucleotide--dimethylbenzimidazole phosphoribosyltransferase n=1 Tax=Falsirhodobacter halotolerans TaxID=1146892 RepID=UPI001FD32050|nr:nicotinate-nucleotide--dimethylbenzimidazole phosphoribosyltransferase [Falsirhodobacter halotolerans]MCJ8139031.1 nicotinate-nucleotide--dimethylbenzimidazole phosphoribosyltransferase [Falsirhodobacter halotolerans]
MTLREYLDALTDLPPPDPVARAEAEARQASLTKPPGSLGRLEDLAVFMAGWQGRARPRIARAQALVFAGNHGICDRGVNPFPQAVTAQMVANFRAGGAAINQLCAVAGADLSVVALDLDRPTQDFTRAPAMTEAEVLDALRTGGEAVDPLADVLIVGEMGIGNSTTAAALACATFGGAPFEWVGPGTGAPGAMQALKAQVIGEGLARHADLLGTPLGAFRAFGGREQAAMAGAVIAARRHRVPVILDGFIGTASVAPLAPWLDHCLIGHVSAEPGHAVLAGRLGKRPILDLGMRLGEGSGAAVALMVLRAALAAHDGMATFAEAGVSDA